MTGTGRVKARDADATTDVADNRQLEAFGYRPELRRTLSLFSNFGIAFTYLSPVVGVYSLFVLGLGAGGPRYLWLMPIVVAGQLLVALVFAELASMYPIAGALFQWAKNLLGPGYAWFVGWAYGWALIVTVAAVDTGIAPYISSLLNSLFSTNLDGTDPNTILVFTLILMAIQTTFNVVGVRFSALISRMGVYAEVGATFGIAILLAALGFHHGLGFTFSTQGVENAHTNPLGVDFGGNWWLGAALVAILAQVYIFYGFESAGDVAEEVRDASRRVPRAIIYTVLAGFVTSFVLVLAFLLAIPSDGFAKAASFNGGITYIIGANTSSTAVQDIILAFVCFAFFSCGTAIQAAASRVVYSYSRDEALPGWRVGSKVSERFRTPVAALLLGGALLPVLFTLLVHINPSKPFDIGPVVYPADINALLLLVSFGVSGIYLAFQMVVLAALIARLRGWRPTGSFTLGRWAFPVNVLALIYGVAMLVNIVIPTGVNSPRGLLFNYGSVTLAVMIVIMGVGALYFVLGRPDRRIARRIVRPPAVEPRIAPEMPPPGGAPST
jgi:amino acid transporter